MDSAPAVKGPALPTSGAEPLHFSKRKRFRTALGKLQWMAALRTETPYAIKGTQNLVVRIAPLAWRTSQCIELHFMPVVVAQIGQVVQSAESQQLESSVHCGVHRWRTSDYSRTQAIVAQSLAESHQDSLAHTLSHK
eukprot:4373725-Amphidinium_carterae.1